MKLTHDQIIWNNAITAAAAKMFHPANPKPRQMGTPFYAAWCDAQAILELKVPE